ncbi:MAG: hypothetical protein K2H04_08830 [Bacteroidaceae bacterium]|nr:hypothetical protein [Bacteroidaceae bacterium]MDE6000151.1 hypothetical protein [Bacteroidaceae bacterium]MDE6720938.1 hypothetical protein [Bacteroidaceae bacterium]MDE7118350.1 hypothetical protein [Bacteroidaceae bacterium]
MGMFSVRKPRGFHHNYIYYDPRKEKLKEIDERAKRELGLLPPKEFTSEDIRGKFVQATKHLKRRKESGRKPVSYGVLITAIVLLLLLMRYLASGHLWF